MQRLWREEGLRVPARRRKRQRLGESTIPADRLRAERPNHVWAIDFQFDQTAGGRVLKLLNVVDEFTREALAMEAAHSITADRTVRVLERLAHERGAPEHLRCDNGPELTAHALRDWCRFPRAGTAFIDPGAPWQNPFVESFNSRVRDELLDVEAFSCVAEARVLVAGWRDDYNRTRPHSALAMKPRRPSRRPGRPTDERGWEPLQSALRASLHGTQPRTSIACRQDHQLALTGDGPTSGVRSEGLTLQAIADTLALRTCRRYGALPNGQCRLCGVRRAIDARSRSVSPPCFPRLSERVTPIVLLLDLASRGELRQIGVTG